MIKTLTVLVLASALTTSANAGPGGKGKGNGNLGHRAQGHAALLQKYDANKDGKLDEKERAAISKEDRAKMGRHGKGPGKGGPGPGKGGKGKGKAGAN
jgi:hypothetical protein